MQKIDSDHVIDASGYNCPVPIIKTKKLIDTILIGQTIKIISTDPGSMMDITTFCEQTKNSLIHQHQIDGSYIFVIEKT